MLNHSFTSKAGQAMHFANYVYDDYNYEPGPLPNRIFEGVMSGLNENVWKVTEEQGTKDWFVLRRFMLTSTSAVHMLRKLEKLRMYRWN